MNQFSQFKKTVSIAALFAVTTALAPPVFSQQMPGFGPQEAPERADKEQVESACTAIVEWMKKPGMAGLVKGLPYSNYQSRSVAESLNASCHFTRAQWNAMPDLKKTPVNEIIKDKFKVCNNMLGLVHGGAIGILSAFGGKNGGDLAAGEEMLRYACTVSPQEDAAMKAIQAAEKAKEPFTFPEDMPEATQEEQAAACKRLEKGINTDTGASLVFKGSKHFSSYNPAPMADMVIQSCPNITAETIAAAPDSETLLRELAARTTEPKQRNKLSLELAASVACTTIAEAIKTQPGFNTIFSKDKQGFLRSCDADNPAIEPLVPKEP